MKTRTAETASTPLILLGGGGHAAVVAESAVRAGFQLDAIASRDAPAVAAGGPFAQLAWIGDPDDALVVAEMQQRILRGDLVHVAVGDGLLRERLARRAGDDAHLARVIDPSAHISPSAEIGAGVFIGTGAIVHARARVARLAIVNTRAIVEHDCVVHEAAHIAPGAVLCGAVHVGARAHLGAGAVVIPGVRIGHDAIVGAGAVVVRDVADGITVAGVPARPLR